MFRKELLEIERITKKYHRVEKTYEEDYEKENTRERNLREEMHSLSEKLITEFPEFREVQAPADEQKTAERLWRQLVHERHVVLIPAHGFALELRGPLLFNTPEHRGFFLFLLPLIGWHAEIAREKSPHGYHFHYIDTQKQSRANVTFTWDPNEPIGPPDTLYWQFHGPGLSVQPNLWPTNKREDIHRVAWKSIQKPGKQYFRQPGRNGKVLCYQ